MRKEFQRRRDYLVQELLLMGLEVAPADGAFYAFVNTGGDDIGTARRWLEKAHVAVTPGLLRRVSVMIVPAMPSRAEAMRQQLGLPADVTVLRYASECAAPPAVWERVAPGPGLFPRVEA